MITLTAEERVKFAAWCKQESESNRTLYQQAMKLPSLANNTALINQMKMRAAGPAVVAAMLESIQEETVSNDQTSSPPTA